MYRWTVMRPVRGTWLPSQTSRIPSPRAPVLGLKIHLAVAQQSHLWRQEQSCKHKESELGLCDGLSARTSHPDVLSSVQVAKHAAAASQKFRVRVYIPVETDVP